MSYLIKINATNFWKKSWSYKYEKNPNFRINIFVKRQEYFPVSKIYLHWRNLLVLNFKITFHKYQAQGNFWFLLWMVSKWKHEANYFSLNELWPGRSWPRSPHRARWALPQGPCTQALRRRSCSRPRTVGSAPGWSGPASCKANAVKLYPGI